MYDRFDQEKHTIFENLLLLNFPVRNILGTQPMTNLIKKKPSDRNLVMASKTKI